MAPAVVASVRYEWRPGFPARGADPVVVGREIERLRSPDGDVKPLDVIDAAKPKSSPLHPLFDWSDKVAAEKWRLHQARDVLGAIVRVEVDGGTETRVRANVYASGGYHRFTDVASDVGMREEVSGRLSREVEALIERYRSFRRAAGMVDDLRAVLRRWQSAG